MLIMIDFKSNISIRKNARILTKFILKYYDLFSDEKNNESLLSCILVKII